MSKNNEASILIASLVITLGLLGGGYWWFQNKSGNVVDANPSQNTGQDGNQANPNAISANDGVETLANINTSLPNPNLLAIDGSTTMVALIRDLGNAYAQINPNVPLTYGQPNGQPNGSSQGIRNLINNSVALAASSRPLQPDEAQANLQLVAIAKDAVAVVVGSSNPYQGGLSLEQLQQIYLGKITNWSQVGGPNAPIKVINRAANSGTRDLFQNVVLLGRSFAPDGANFITWPQDETTAIIRQLGSNGISYATIAQVENQSTVRIVPINGISPTDKTAIASGNYPISRNIFLVLPAQTSPAAKQFVELALSAQGQQIAQRNGFVPVN